jgi:hypothetical protein
MLETLFMPLMFKPAVSLPSEGQKTGTGDGKHRVGASLMDGTVSIDEAAR